MPLVTVPSRPNGLPMATTASPTSTALESPRRRGSRNDAGASTLITARSVEGSVPTSVARRVDPSQKRTEMRARSFDDVLIGDDVTVVVEDEARSLSRLRPAELCRPGSELDDRLHRALVDVADCQCFPCRRGLGARDRDLAEDRRGVFGESRVRDRADPGTEAEGGYEPGDENRSAAAGIHQASFRVEYRNSSGAL